MAGSGGVGGAGTGADNVRGMEARGRRVPHGGDEEEEAVGASDAKDVVVEEVGGGQVMDSGCKCQLQRKAAEGIRVVI